MEENKASSNGGAEVSLQMGERLNQDSEGVYLKEVLADLDQHEEREKKHLDACADHKKGRHEGFLKGLDIGKRLLKDMWEEKHGKQ